MIPPAARRKVMAAAASTETTTAREAAIVGAIVRCAIATGRYNGHWIAQAAVDVITEFNLVNVDRTPPGPTEVGMVLERFEEAYGRRFTA
jgi:hypothetical protein